MYMIKILILNVGCSNKGTFALVISTMNTIRNFVPGAQFSLMGSKKIDNNNVRIKKSVYSGLNKRRPHDAVISILCLFKCACINIFNRFGVHIPVTKNSRLFDYYDCDIIINSGGDHLSGEAGFSASGNFLNILYAILLDKPIVLYGESLGYFKNSLLNFTLKIILNRTRLILVREELSAKYLSNNDIINPRIFFTADPAFLLDPAPKSYILDILSKEGINEIQTPLIGINPSGLIKEFIRMGHKINDKIYYSILAKVIDSLIDNLNATIIMIPHVYSEGTDDRVAISNISNMVKNISSVKTIKNEYTPQELKGIIGLCDLFIGARMHATIASTSMFVPTVGIAYSHKMHGIIGKMLGQEKYVVNIDELEYETLVSKINDAWENREMIKRELEIKIPEIKNKAMLNGKYVKDLLDSLENS